MSNARYTPEFKDEAVRQVVERGHPVAEVAERLGVSSHSLYNWIKSLKPGKNELQTQELNEAKKEILKLRAQLRRAEEDRDILKKAAVDSAGHCNTYLNYLFCSETANEANLYSRRTRSCIRPMEATIG